MSDDFRWQVDVGDIDPADYEDREMDLADERADLEREVLGQMTYAERQEHERIVRDRARAKRAAAKRRGAKRTRLDEPF